MDRPRYGDLSDEDMPICDCNENRVRLAIFLSDQHGRHLCSGCFKWNKDKAKTPANVLEARKQERLREQEKAEERRKEAERKEREKVDPSVEQNWKVLESRIDTWLYRGASPIPTRKNLQECFTILQSYYDSIKHNPQYVDRYNENYIAIQAKLKDLGEVF
jgi:hypothetical protein